MSVVTASEFILMRIYVRTYVHTQLTKAYMAETSCNQLLLIDSFC